MEEKSRKWEAIIHSKIYDFEVDTSPDDWGALSARLDESKKVRFVPYRKYTLLAASAAVLALLMVGGYLIFFNDKSKSDGMAANEIPATHKDETTPKVEEGITVPFENQIDNALVFAFASAIPVEKGRNVIAIEKDTEVEPSKPFSDGESTQNGESEVIIQAVAVTPESVQDSNTDHFTIDQSHFAAVTKEKKPRRWGFGVGGGGYALGSTTGANGVATTSKMLNDEDLMRNSDVVHLRGTGTLFDQEEGFKSEINHELPRKDNLMPISFGLGVSYKLSDHLSLQSGVVYTLLRSKEKYYEADILANSKQNLHFVGIPLSLSYTIANWKRVFFYVSVGGMGEWNFAGKKISTIIVDELETIKNEKVRMKEPLWSVNSRLGADYPLWKFLHLYGEVGVSYYFDTPKSIETIRSDKPFNVSLQAGLRLGF